ncbi:6,7-dimethyl-8-ribityllumazine synthase [Phenylobacterium sp.]|uniref:6,7-dimethyl-8-ribityllumazine synthase n=1 Tax=Phenylobacterium sp. TaxID=1871053 RepID=UPI0027330B85|nr:6,7-dimethyl-8-ribityllumazine synthase [Phenylobacterium sp.]MDP3174840.1 6,7-dimethyl-8-ribityllumazine synthase [Phenylobacterium sp.]MDP3658461.1 6,7-dimethyl-8-ribityllumazine synthase [Phenylobacterium sp.]
MIEEKIRILIVEARFYSDLADELLKSAVDVITAHDAEYEVISVPGALEIPGAIAIAEEGGHRPAGFAYDGYVALGTVIRGETYHFEIVSNESARGLMELATGRRLAIGNGILTVEDEAQAWARARASEGDKGGGAARAALEMVALKRRLLGQTR